jgi:putative sterol carrier protein
MLSKLMSVYTTLLTVLFVTIALCYGGELIEATRTLQEAGKRWGKVVVFSEPPELDVFLDGSRVGQTPLWLERVKEGTHNLQIKGLEKEIYVKDGRTLKVGLFKGRFITVLEAERKEAKEGAPEKKEHAAKAEAEESPEKQKETDLSRWEKFLNGSLKHF